ncbi:MAG: carbamate kinase [Gammaproteobacteria bacterium]|jgi:carbamate kinase|nr:carbamate kinase [Gammaproteobacteria bacterium]
MRIVIALGGNALLHRGEALSAENQRTNVKIAAAALAPLALEHQLVITHGNGPQVGLLALQYSAHKEGVHYPLDILDAESEGMIGYLVEQELSNLLPAGHRCATLLTQTEVDPNDPAFQNPTKPIGPVYDRTEARRLAVQRGWSIAPDGEFFRRVVPSPRPRQILEMGVIELLVERQVTVICAGGGGIPVVRRKDGQIIGVEAVIDKDFASALLARELGADALVMLTDVEAVYQGWGEADARALRRVSAGELRQLKFVPGSMGPKVAAACEFVEQAGGLAGIGQLKDASALLSGEAGTLITQDASDTLWWD